jgi:hypothetical protein
MIPRQRNTAGGAQIRKERAQDFGIAIDKLPDLLAVELKGQRSCAILESPTSCGWKSVGREAGGGGQEIQSSQEEEQRFHNWLGGDHAGNR